MSGDTGRQSSSEVAHEAEDTRANLASTLEQLRNNLRPENVMDEVVFNARIGASTVADNIVGVAKQYPIPSMLISTETPSLMDPEPSEVPQATTSPGCRGTSYERRLTSSAG